jgi:hypothetical protein
LLRQSQLVLLRQSQLVLLRQSQLVLLRQSQLVLLRQPQAVRQTPSKPDQPKEYLHQSRDSTLEVEQELSHI